MQAQTLSDVERRMAEDFAWAMEAAPVQQNPDHFGKLVVVYNKQVLAVGRERDSLVEQAAKTVGVPGSQMVVVLVPRPGLWETPR